MNLVINGLQHVGIPVTNISVSISFYERLGFKNVMTAPFEIDGEKGQCTMMQRDNFVIELYQMPSKELKEIKSRGMATLITLLSTCLMWMKRCLP